MINELYNQLKEQEYSPEDAYRISDKEKIDLFDIMKQAIGSSDTLQHVGERTKVCLQELTRCMEGIEGALSDKEIYNRNLAKLMEINKERLEYLSKVGETFNDYLDGIKEMLRADGVFTD